MLEILLALLDIVQYKYILVTWVAGKIFLGSPVEYLILGVAILCALRWVLGYSIVLKARWNHDLTLNVTQLKIHTEFRPMELFNKVGQDVTDLLFQKSNSIKDPLELLNSKRVTSTQ